MKRNNLNDFEYEIVETLVVSDNYVDVMFLSLEKTSSLSTWLEMNKKRLTK